MDNRVNKDIRKVRNGELALVLGVFINSFGVVLMLYSGSGIFAISSLPYAFSKVLPYFSLGTWTYLFQGLLVIVLMVSQKRWIPEYLFSFVVGFAFGKLLDVHELWISVLPRELGWRIAYFLVSYSLICIGITLMNRCGLPIIPTDLFPRELTKIFHLKYSRVKIGFDVSCLCISVIMTEVFLGHLEGIGIGTIVAAFTTGKTVGKMGEWTDKRYRFVSVLSEKNIVQM